VPSGTDPVQIDQQGGWQFLTAAATDARGNSVVVNNSLGDDGTNYQKIYARRVDPQGNVVGDPFRVNTDESSDMVPGGIAMAPDGRYVIVWYGAGPGHDGTDIYARRYNADDTPADAVEFRVNQFTSGLQWYPTVSMDSDGNFAVAFTDQGRDATQLPQAYARLFSWDLQSISPDFPLEAVSVGNQWSQTPRVSMAAGTLVGAYNVYTSSQDQSGWAAFLQRFSYAVNATTGAFDVTPVGGAIMPYLDGAGDQGVTPVVASDGSFTAVIDNSPSGVGSEDIYLRRFAADATPLDAALIPVTTAAGDQWTNGAGLDGNGNLFISWRDGGWGNNWDLYAREFNSDATPMTDPMRITPHTEQFHWLSVGGIAVAPDGSLTAVWTTYRPDADGFGVEARHYDPILSSTTETDTLTDASTGDQVSVTSTATTFVDSVLWEYRVTNNGSADLGQFSISGQPENVTDASNSLGWTMNSTGTGWTASSGQPLLTPAQEAFFTFTTPSAYAVRSTAATAGGGDGSTAATGSTLGPSPTVTETTTLTLDDEVYGEEDVRITSSATVFDDHILWQYQWTNLSYIGSYSSDVPDHPPGVMTFDVPVVGGEFSNVTVPAGWTWANPGTTFVAQTDNYVPVGGGASFSFTTPVTAIAQVWAGAGQGHWGPAAAGYVFGAVQQTLTATLDPYIPVNADNDNYRPKLDNPPANHPEWGNGPNHAQWVSKNGVVQPGIPYIRDFKVDHLWQPDPDMKPLVISWSGNGGIVSAATFSASMGVLAIWADPYKNDPFTAVDVQGTSGTVTVFVEGVHESQAVNDLTVRVVYTDNNGGLQLTTLKETVTPVVQSLEVTPETGTWPAQGQNIVPVGADWSQGLRALGKSAANDPGFNAATFLGKVVDNGIYSVTPGNFRGIDFVQNVTGVKNGANGGWVYTPASNLPSKNKKPVQGTAFPFLDVGTGSAAPFYSAGAANPRPVGGIGRVDLINSAWYYDSDGPQTGVPANAQGQPDNANNANTQAIDVMYFFRLYFVAHYADGSLYTVAYACSSRQHGTRRVCRTSTYYKALTPTHSGAVMPTLEPRPGRQPTGIYYGSDETYLVFRRIVRAPTLPSANRALGSSTCRAFLSRCYWDSRADDRILFYSQHQLTARDRRC
jgi:hypothetical protein